ncbi:MAG TPA: hypothetical protein HPQ00_05210 [Magnetococcales bacterium]|nr:hypothetical protein [Magnetococcales bacterium]
MAALNTVRFSDGLFSITILEVFAGSLFIGFILLSAAVMLEQKKTVVPSTSPPGLVAVGGPKDGQTGGGDGAVDGLAERLVEKLDRNFRHRDERLGRMIVSLGDKLDHIKESRELNWSQLRHDIDERLEAFVQEAALQGPRLDSLRVVGGDVEGSVQVAQASVPVVTDVVEVADKAAGDGGGVSVKVAQVLPTQVETAKEKSVMQPQSAGLLGLEDGVFNPVPVEDQKRGFFISLGCFSQARNAVDRGKQVRPFAASIYRKQIRDGAMSCVFSGPYGDRAAAGEVLRRMNEGTRISGFSLGSY